MFLVSLPGYTRRARPVGVHRPDEVGDLLSFADFVEALLGWVRWWNTGHRPSVLASGLTPMAAWEADPTPVEDVPEEQLAFFSLEDDGRVRKISTSGVRWRRRFYIAPWMVGHVGTRVRLRYLPHHDGQVEVFSASIRTVIWGPPIWQRKRRSSSAESSARSGRRRPVR
ncbi:Mu transposase C-terminal domain-containing protein [Streptomyces sp. DH24]|uniref:Mu transposase C-terminal domain-containing protein n=1 Tax=Streptomyces sp. DH24 TaxID=3040123 RepID=UPI0024434535|nr:Mu transposase C-terminal domain-containing protein [Streptomyces sp. DH24]MDG9720110.1 Mu transposase C-terminal domain-containing protein [Streptomyces sp. DH24]